MSSNDTPPAPPPPPAEALQSFVSGPFSAAVSKLASRSHGIPSDKDFHFFNNFPEFKSPINSIKNTSTSSLQSIADSSALWGANKPPKFPDDLDDAYDWLVGLNDDFLERFSVSIDEFKSSREDVMEEDGFRLVGGRKERSGRRDEGASGFKSEDSVNVVIKDEKVKTGRSKVPFHVPGIRRPQDEHTIQVNNENAPFDHVWLEKTADCGRYIHPMEKLSIENFIDRNIEEVDPVKPLPLDRTPFKLVEAVNDLREMAAKLRAVNEFAVDLEHNHYRSFQGLTCLMQISTRTEDFVVDTLKLRIQIGPHLREIFKDPSKRKVMHGADRDIIWLQRDFGIYVCNLFDTGQASRALQLERNSLEYLLHYFCGVTANKEYQNADWRLRPLPNEMVKYAREDTHYLLYIYDVMKRSLLSSSSNENDLLLEVYKRSAETCMQLYEKELLTDTSYLHIYGVMDAELNAEQLAVVAGLSQWRDTVARAEDESTGYILPNKTLIEIAKQMPNNPGKLKRLVKSRHPYVERNLSSVLGIIKSSIANSVAFQSAAQQLQQLKEARAEASVLQNMEAGGDDIDPDHDIDIDPIEADTPPLECSLEVTNAQVQSKEVSAMNIVCEKSDVVMPVAEAECSSGLSSICKQVEGENGGSQGIERKATVASVQLLRKPSCGFGALFGNSASKRKNAPLSTFNEQAKNEDKIIQIKSSVTLPFHYFSEEKPTKSPKKTDADGSLGEAPLPRVADTNELGDVIPLEERNDETESPSNDNMEDEIEHREELFPLPARGSGQDSQPESEATEDAMSPSDLSSSFGKCFQSINESRGSQNCRKNAEKPVISFQVPFDYAAARKNMNFSDVPCDDKAKGKESIKTPISKEPNKRPAVINIIGEEKSKGSQPRRRQAFPPTGNRSMSYH